MRHRTYRFPRVAIALARNAKTGQTSLQLDNSSTGGAFESFSDAHDQAKEAKSQEGPREGSQASEKTEPVAVTARRASIPRFWPILISFNHKRCIPSLETSCRPA
ncbi:MAG TPA: hypothetical protein VGA56_21340 [Opitutaceae bacterium]